MKRDNTESLALDLIDVLLKRVQDQNQIINEQKSLIAQLGTTNAAYQAIVTDTTKTLHSNNDARQCNICYKLGEATKSPTSSSVGTMTEPLELVFTRKVSRIVQSVAQTESREVEAKTDNSHAIQNSHFDPSLLI